MYLILGYLGFTILLALSGVLIVRKQLKSLQETTTGYTERTDDEIITAWEKWLEGSPDPDIQHLSCGFRLFSDREFVEAIKSGNEEARYLAIKCPRILAKELGTDPVEDIISSRQLVDGEEKN